MHSEFYGGAISTGMALVVPLTSRDRGLVWQPRLSLTTRDGAPSVALVEQMRAVSNKSLQHRVNGVRLAPKDVESITFVMRQMIAGMDSP